MLYIADSFAGIDPVLNFTKTVRSGEDIYTHKDYSECLIIKIENDFDQDGDTDFLLSSRCPYGNNGGWGNAGGLWQVYFNVDGTYHNPHAIFFHPLAINIIPTGKNEEFKIKSYHRSGASEGTFSIKVVTVDSVKSLSGQNYKNMDIKDSEGKTLYKNTFQKKILLHLE